MTAPRRKDLPSSVFIVVLVVVLGAMAWFFAAHPGRPAHGHTPTADTGATH